MKYRTVALLLTLVLAFGLYAMTRYTLNLTADNQGYDAIDYVTLHGSVQHEHPASPVRPIDVIGVYIHEGYANSTMIELLRYLPKLRSVTIGPDYSGIPAGTPVDQLPKPSEIASADVEKIRDAFPTLQVNVAEFRTPDGA